MEADIENVSRLRKLRTAPAAPGPGNSREVSVPPHRSLGVQRRLNAPPAAPTEHSWMLTSVPLLRTCAPAAAVAEPSAGAWPAGGGAGSAATRPETSW